MKGRKFIDFNGVILDTESRMIELKRQYPGLTWNEFANTLNWDFLLRTSPVIDDAIALLREVSQMDDARTTILTNVDLIVEEIAKVHFYETKELRCQFNLFRHLSKSLKFIFLIRMIFW